MRFLLDSHTLLWAIFDRSKLSSRVLALLEDDANDLAVSVVTLWELAIKVGLGRLRIPGSSTLYLSEQIDRIGATILLVKPAHVRRLEAMPQHPGHRDPWDRMLVAQAIEEKRILISSDSKIQLYEVEIVWK